MAPTLLVLAAGLGSRFGGLKQIEPVGPSGETVLDYAVYDAMRAGFGRVVFVIRHDFADVFRQKIGARYAGRVAVDYVFQSSEALPAGCMPRVEREKPWGTGHAVWCAREIVQEKFAVINADDFYGADSFAQLAKFLRGPDLPPSAWVHQFAMVGFRLANTLSEHGVVSRGICTVGPDGWLRTIVEETGISAAEVGAGGKFSGAEIVSMNCWGFTPAVFAALDGGLREFHAAKGDQPKAEYYLPTAISEMIGDDEATVHVLPTASTWFGVTYRDDKPRVESAIAKLIKAKDYPAKLF
jgi:hypothetical protein